MNSQIRLREAVPAELHLACPLCSDEGLPAQVLSIDETGTMASVRMGRGVSEVALDLLEEARVGDYILVHLDTAIARLRREDVVEE